MMVMTTMPKEKIKDQEETQGNTNLINYTIYIKEMKEISNKFWSNLHHFSENFSSGSELSSVSEDELVSNITYMYTSSFNYQKSRLKIAIRKPIGELLFWNIAENIKHLYVPIGIEKIYSFYFEYESIPVYEKVKVSNLDIAYILVEYPKSLEVLLLLADTKILEVKELEEKGFSKKIVLEVLDKLQKYKLINKENRKFSITEEGVEIVKKLRSISRNKEDK